MTSPIVAVHGIWNLQAGLAPEEAAAKLGAGWSARLSESGQPAPELVVAYYAHLLASHAQGAGTLDDLNMTQREWAASWMNALGVNAAGSQGPLTYPLRQGLDWVARRWERGAEVVGRIMAGFLGDFFVYMTRPGVRARCQEVVRETIARSGARIVVAHSLGSVVAYEALCANPDLEVDLFLTLGSPLGLRGVVFEGLVPEPIGGRAVRPPNVRRWVNIADRGDLVALPRRLGDAFPVDRHEEIFVGKMDFHTFGAYLAAGPTAAALTEA